MNPVIVPKRQHPPHSSKGHAKAAKEEVNKLKQARAIKYFLSQVVDQHCGR